MRSRNADFLCAVVIVGLLAGVAGLATTLLLRSLEHLTYHYTFGSLLEGVTGSSPARRAAGADGRRRAGGAGLVVTARRGPMFRRLAARHRRPSSASACCRSVSTRALQVLVVGSGASLGREVAPRQFAVALGDFATGWLRRLSARRPRDPAGVCGGRRTRRGVCGAARWCAVRAADHVEDLASPSDGRRVDHLQPGVSQLPRSPPTISRS